MPALRLNGKWVEVESMEHAALLVTKDVDETGVGSEEWYSHPLQGEVREAGTPIGHVSYNGRIWPAEVKP